MTTYNTGNPIGSTDPRDLFDNAENLDDAVNGTGLTWIDRLNKLRLTYAGLEDRAATGEKRYNTKAQMDATTGTSGSSARVLNDAVSANNGLYTWDMATSAWVKSANDPLAAYFSLNSLTINSGKPYPFLRKIRKGINFGPRPEFLDAVLFLRVWGIDDRFYYRLGIIANGNANLGGPSGQGFRMEKCAVSAFETTGVSSTIHNNTSEIGLGLDYTAGGIQYRRIAMDLDPGVIIEIVIDLSKLPAFGTAIVAVTESSAGYNWIIDPAEYRVESYPDDTGGADLTDIDSLNINEDKDFPMVRVDRGGTASNWVHPVYRAAILDFRVLNARPGYVYRMGNLQCEIENTTTGALEYGFVLNRIPIDRLAEGYEQRIVNLGDGTEMKFDYEKGGIQELSIRATTDPDTIINVVADVSRLPRGGGITSNNIGAHGFNSIISTSRCNYMAPFQFRDGDCMVDYDHTTGLLKFCFLSKTKWYRWHFRKKSINNTFTLLGYGYADAYSLWGDLIPVEFATFVTRTEADSDWLAPFVFHAVNNGDPGVTTPQYSSGSHGSDGGGGGGATAESMLVNIYVDGTKLDTTKSRKGVCESARICTANRVKGWNTFVSGRYIGEEYFTLDLKGGACFVHKTFTALEDVVVEGDNGCQVYMAGMTPLTSSTYLMWGANQTARQLFANTPFDSGPKSQYPNVFGVSVRHPVSGEMTAWIDPNYGVGNREFLAPTAPMLELPRENGKMYFRLFQGMGGLALAAGESYEWRGGYHIGMPTNAESFDSVQETQAGIVYVKPNGRYSVS